MKVASFRNHSGKVCIGVKIGDNIADLTAGLEKYLVEEAGVSSECATDVAGERMPDSMLDLLRREEEGQADLRLTVAYIDKSTEKGKALFSPRGNKITYGLEEVTLLTPVPQVDRIFNMEYNYPAYEKVYNSITPDDGTAAMFMMDHETIIGPGDDIKWPVTAKEVTAAVELGVIIGKQGKRIKQAEALNYVFGYTVVKDITGISLLRPGVGPGRHCLPAAYYFTRATIMDTFQPVGPFITLKDEIPDPQGLEAELRVNSKITSRGNTRDMRCSVARLIEFLSQDITLEAGDLISTGAIGTLEHMPEASVKVGDVTEAEIEKIGVLRNSVIA